MSVTSTAGLSDVTPAVGKKRKVEHETELEVDLGAPEPPSKKARRKAKSQRPPKNVRNAGLDTPVKAKDADATKRSRYGIWIGNLPFTATGDGVKAFLTTDKVHVITESQMTRINLPQGGKGLNKGFAYVDFTDATALHAALQLSEKLFSGRRVLIKNAGDFEGRPDVSKTETKSSAPSTDRIFVGNLAFDTTKDDLRHHLDKCGAVQDVFMATFEDSGKCKGYAWVTFKEVASAEAAIRGWVEVNEAATEDGRAGKRRIWVSRLKGQKLRMEFAEDKVTRYNKRFGKNARLKQDQDGAAEDVEKSLEPPSTQEAAAKPVEHLKGPPGGSERPTNKQSRRYSAATVTKLTGAIVATEGKKTTFD